MPDPGANYDTGEVLPLKWQVDPRTGKRVAGTWPQLAMPGVLSGLLVTARLPGDVLTGRSTIEDPDTLQRIVDAGWNLAQGGLGVSSGVERDVGGGALGMFLGRRAQGAPTGRLGRAMTLENRVVSEGLNRGESIERLAPASRDATWETHGWFRGADGEWKWEEPDTGARLKPGSLNGEGNNLHTPYRERDPDGAWIPWQRKLPDVLDHLRLYDRYPFLKNIKIRPTAMEDFSSRGAYAPDTKTIYLGGGDPYQLTSTLLHEVQHAIQHHEGWGFGGSPAQFLPQDPLWHSQDRATRNAYVDASSALLDKGANVAGIRRSLEGSGTDWDLTSLREAREHRPEFDNYVRALNARRPYELEHNRAYDLYRALSGEAEAFSTQHRFENGYGQAPWRDEGFPPFEDQSVTMAPQWEFSPVEHDPFAGKP